VNPRWIICACLTTLSLACAGVPARAVTYVDGISDQSLPTWDGGFHDSWFAGLFHETWVGDPGSHIAFARYVVQWNLMSGKYSRYLTEFEAWLNDVGSFGLKPMIALAISKTRRMWRAMRMNTWRTSIPCRSTGDGESGQAERADWLVSRPIKNAKPEHVFYYEFLLKERRRPDCQTEGSDSALYEPSADPAEPDRPRPAASYIWGGESTALESTALGYEDGGDAFMANAAQTTLTGGVGI